MEFRFPIACGRNYYRQLRIRIVLINTYGRLLPVKCFVALASRGASSVRVARHAVSGFVRRTTYNSRVGNNGGMYVERNILEWGSLDTVRGGRTIIDLILQQGNHKYCTKVVFNCCVVLDAGNM